MFERSGAQITQPSESDNMLTLKRFLLPATLSPRPPFFFVKVYIDGSMWHGSSFTFRTREKRFPFSHHSLTEQILNGTVVNNPRAHRHRYQTHTPRWFICIGISKLAAIITAFDVSSRSAVARLHPFYRMRNVRAKSLRRTSFIQPYFGVFSFCVCDSCHPSLWWTKCISTNVLDTELSYFCAVNRNHGKNGVPIRACVCQSVCLSYMICI